MTECKECGTELTEREIVTIGNYKYTITDEQLGVKYADIKIPKGWELWEPEEAVAFHKDIKLREKLNLKNCSFYIQSKYYLPKSIARFYANSGRVGLDCGRDPRDSDSGLGVRFKRKVKP